jgi:hypothetical protein
VDNASDDGTAALLAAHPGRPEVLRLPVNAGYAGGLAAALRRAGGVPAAFFCYYEDTDTAWRLRLANHTIVSVPEARVIHRHGASTRPGSRQFHLWNERNRLAMLLRCAPAAVAAREVARFAAITALLPLRRLRLLTGRRDEGPLPHTRRDEGPLPHTRRPAEPPPWNFRVGLRLRVLGELAASLPRILRERRAVTDLAEIPRSAVWRASRSPNPSG